ncbi:hypothetical protein FACS189413_17850 [Bacteroidia bacterium]|nr:hypothetical protein FACS189413_17850 [Bacteroidia bacterium]
MNENKAKTGGISNPNVVIGISMGGLIARYALRSMELYPNNYGYHDTWKYFSLDSPHKGANLPLGLQGMIRDLQNFSVAILGGLTIVDAASVIPMMDQLYGVLDSKAARQMLIYYCNKNLKIDNNEYEAFQKEYDRIGFPVQCQNIAVSCGSIRGATEFTPATRLFSFSPSKDFNWYQSLGIGIASIFSTLVYTSVGDANAWEIFGMGLLNLVLGSSAIKTNFYINALPDKKAAKVYEGQVYYEKKILWVIPVRVDISNRNLSSTATMLPLDGAAGSFNSFESIKSDNENFRKLLEQFKKSRFTFVPTSSSLAFSNLPLLFLLHT